MTKTPDVVAGQKITSPWGNEIRDRTRQVFASNAERDAQWLSPPNGASCTVLDSNSDYYRQAGVWKPARPGQVVSQALTPQTNIPGAVFIGGGGYSVPLAYRQYRVFVSVNVFKSSSTGDVLLGCQDSLGTRIDTSMTGITSPGRANFRLSGSFTAVPGNLGGAVFIQPYVGTCDVVDGRLWVDDIGGV
jgi:hypothetical protein